jgi:hypothetical protein
LNPPKPSTIQDILSASLSRQQHTLNAGKRKKFQAARASRP